MDKKALAKHLATTPLQFKHKGGLSHARLHVSYDADEALALLKPVADGLPSDVVSATAARASRIWAALSDVGSAYVPLDETLAAINQELGNGPIDALTLISMCTLAHNAAQLQAQLPSILKGVSGSDKRHNQNGSRERGTQIQAMWHAKEYPTKTKCAEAAIEKYPDIDFEAALEWLSPKKLKKVQD